jgi:hypothetical protein
MSSFALHAFPSHSPTRGVRLTKKADGIVLMGALVKKGSAAGEVTETAATTDIIMGVSLISETMILENEAEQYADEDALVIETLVDGAVLNLLNSGTASIAEGAKVEATADGKIVAGSTDPVGVTNEVIAGSARGPVIIQQK